MLNASLKGNVNELQKLIDKGAYVNTNLSQGTTPLMAATYHQKIDAVKFLLNEGADVNAKDIKGDTALNRAVTVNNLAIAKVLLDHDADPNSNYLSKSPLSQAAQKNNLAMVQLLVKHGADVKLGDGKSDTPLMYTSKLDIVKFLVEKGANVNAINRDQSTVLMSFLNISQPIEERVKIMSFLIEHKADVNTISNLWGDDVGNTILDSALLHKYPKPIIDLLRKHGAKTAKELNAKKHTNQTKN